MGTGRKFRTKPVTRPKKAEVARKVRYKVHRARLVAIGFDAAEVVKMDVGTIKDLLKQHAKNSTRKFVEALLKK